MHFELIDSWRATLRYAWSVRLMLIAALLSGLEVALNIITAFQIKTGIPPGLFAGLAGLVTVAAFIARFISQQPQPPAPAQVPAPAAAPIAAEASPPKRSKFMGLFTPRNIVVGGAAGASAVTALVLAAKIIAPWEGLATKAYPDRLAHNIPTICYGETDGVKLGDVRTPAQCVQMLQDSLPKYVAGMRKCLKVALPAETEAAFISTTYNIGVGAFCKSAMVARVNRGDNVGACNALMAYVNSAGQFRKGLYNRRADERKHCLAGFASAAKAPAFSSPL